MPGRPPSPPRCGSASRSAAAASSTCTARPRAGSKKSWPTRSASPSARSAIGGPAPDRSARTTPASSCAPCTRKRHRTRPPSPACAPPATAKPPTTRRRTPPPCRPSPSASGAGRSSRRCWRRLPRRVRPSSSPGRRGSARAICRCRPCMIRPALRAMATGAGSSGSMGRRRPMPSIRRSPGRSGSRAAAGWRPWSMAASPGRRACSCSTMPRRPGGPRRAAARPFSAVSPPSSRWRWSSRSVATGRRRRRAGRGRSRSTSSMRRTPVTCSMR